MTHHAPIQLDIHVVINWAFLWLSITNGAAISFADLYHLIEHWWPGSLVVIHTCFSKPLMKSANSAYCICIVYINVSIAYHNLCGNDVGVNLIAGPDLITFNICLHKILSLPYTYSFSVRALSVHGVYASVLVDCIVHNCKDDPDEGPLGFVDDCTPGTLGFIILHRTFSGLFHCKFFTMKLWTMSMRIMIFYLNISLVGIFIWACGSLPRIELRCTS